MDERYLLGVDVGTTALKVILFARNGEIVKGAVREYELSTPSPHHVECDPETYWESLRSCIQEVLKDVALEDVVALAISSQGETLVPVDREGSPLRNAIVWLDDRAGDEAEEIGRAFPPEQIYRTTGQPEVLPNWPACKILWLKKKEPSVFRSAHKFLLLEDYLILRLTGRAVGDYSLYTSSLMLDIVRKGWWEEMLKLIGISQDRLPELAESGTYVGSVANEEVGLSPRTAVVTGGMDQVCGMVGVGNIAPGIVSETTGGALAICATTGKPIFDPLRRIPCHYHALRDTYFLLPWCQTGGMALKWLRDNFDYPSYDEMTAEAGKVPPGSEGLIVLPHLAGAGSPDFNPRARGVFFGVALSTTKAHFVRATMEAIGYMLKQNVEVLEGLGVKVERVYSMGGGSRSPLWNQIKADITEKPIITVQNEETACLGAAILAGLGVGAFSSLEEACRKMNKEKARYLPRQENVRTYREAYRKYLEISEALLPLF
ncbi:MAG: hypothetical protein DRP94_05020 [Candidatus Latescibacterota bacterium]|nr:MAG: hypothetical protein DRP94_05020 [Candidatus Latescibacterota bacterium]RKY74637.1 MAG: hypothetical protein DRQ14_01300 [Candidatus Latescibacterota bacterium]